MAGEVSLFQNGEFGSVRVVMRDGEPWFVAKDVAEALEYPESSIATIGKLIQCVPEEWKGRNPIPTLGGTQELAVIAEQGLYFFLARSDKPKALPFQKWLAGEVLPSIRKTGGYGQTPALPDFTNPAAAARAWADEYEGRQRAELALTQTREELSQTKDALVRSQEALAIAAKDAYEAKAALGMAGNYRQVKGIDWVPEMFDIKSEAFWGQLGKAFSAICKHFNAGWKEEEDFKYGTVRAYPKDMVKLLEKVFTKMKSYDDEEFKKKVHESRVPRQVLNMRKYLRKS